MEHILIDEDVQKIDNNKVLIQNMLDVYQRNILHVFYRKIMNDDDDFQVMYLDNVQVLI